MVESDTKLSISNLWKKGNVCFAVICLVIASGDTAALKRSSEWCPADLTPSTDVQAKKAVDLILRKTAEGVAHSTSTSKKLKDIYNSDVSFLEEFIKSELDMPHSVSITSNPDTTLEQVLLYHGNHMVEMASFLKHLDNLQINLHEEVVAAYETANTRVRELLCHMEALYTSNFQGELTLPAIKQQYLEASNLHYISADFVFMQYAENLQMSQLDLLNILATL